MARIALLLLFLLCQLAHAVASIWMLICIVAGSSRSWRIIVAYDRVANAATGGKDTETISSRAARGMKDGARSWCVLCRLLDYFDKNHCEKFTGR